MNSVAQAHVGGQTVIVRADLDLAQRHGQPETLRLRRLMPTLKLLLAGGARVALIGHRGRPEGRPSPNLSTKDYQPLISELLGNPVGWGGEVVAPLAVSEAVTLYENLRFNPGEEANSPDFVQALLKLGQIYVNEAFADSHRAHASIVSVPKYLPHFAGLNLVDEVAHLSRVLQTPARPLVVIIGGAKIATKKPLIEFMNNLADEILVGGALINEGITPTAKVILPVDGNQGKDIGPLTITRFQQSINSAAMIIWNGPLGMFEDPQFAVGTNTIARSVAESSAETILGGGDTIAAVDELGLLDKFSFVSTGGGAMLEFLSGRTLPGLAALQ